MARRLADAWLAGAPWLFVREMWNRPASVGAICPSSRWLADRVASRVPLDGDGLVLELGAGTGAMTHALLRRGIPATRLVVIERSALFVRHLRARFPAVAVVEGDAGELAALVPRGARVDATVSSLPLRSLDEQDSAAIVAEWRGLMEGGGVVVQFTYDLLGRERTAVRGFRQRTSDIVWINLPPARVLAMERGGD